ncbi:MAG TPA: LemA family protein [Gemmatimonadaceae bacterium]|nr:LemA family protein [Gemmatimonadaceae bacterium]
MTRLSLVPVLAALTVLTTGCGYNTIQTLDVNADQARSQIEVQLQRRADLIPNLVRTVERFAQQEQAVFTQVAQARAGLVNAIQSRDPAQMAQANEAVTSALGRLMVVVENYPQLKSDQNFLQLQDELTGTENRIAVARGDYNNAARDYNAYIRRFPQVMTAKVIGARPKNFFEAAAGSREAPQVQFQPPAGTTPATTPPATSTPSTTPAPSKVP